MAAAAPPVRAPERITPTARPIPGCPGSLRQACPGPALDVKFQATTTDSLAPALAGAGHAAMLCQRTGDDQGGPGDPAAFITVVIDRTDGAGLHPDDLAVQLHGVGTWEALVIAEALADAAGRLVILDEPAVTLHPTWQRALRAMIGTAAGQFLVITHSADLVPMGNADDLASLVKTENEAGQTRAHRFDHATLARDDVSRITREFALSAEPSRSCSPAELSWLKAKPS
jgi:hypothetical protein